MVAGSGRPGGGVGVGSTDKVLRGCLGSLAPRGGVDAGTCLSGTAPVGPGIRNAGWFQPALCPADRYPDRALVDVAVFGGPAPNREQVTTIRQRRPTSPTTP